MSCSSAALASLLDGGAKQHILFFLQSCSRLWYLICNVLKRLVAYFYKPNDLKSWFVFFDLLSLTCLKNTICNLSYFVFMGCPYCVVYLLYVHNEQGYTTPIVIIFLRILLLFSTKTSCKELTCYFPVFVWI